MNRPLVVELFAGTASLTLHLLGGAPLVGFMGSKRRLAPAIASALGVSEREGLGGVVLVDAGPWGRVWPTVLGDRGDDVSALLFHWAIEEDPFSLWHRLAAQPEPEDDVEHAAAYLWLQARSASATPVWWGPRVVMSDKPGRPPQAAQQAGTRSATHAGVVMPEKGGRGPVKPAVQRSGAVTKGQQGGRPAKQKGGIPRGCNGMQTPLTIAKRLQALRRLSWPPVQVLRAHPEPEDLGDVRGAVVYLDPPYVGCTPYAVDCPREEVLRLARAYDDAGAVVAVSEAVALDDALGPGWVSVALPGKKAEWLTMNRPVQGQLPLFPR